MHVVLGRPQDHVQPEGGMHGRQLFDLPDFPFRHEDAPKITFFSASSEN